VAQVVNTFLYQKELFISCAPVCISNSMCDLYLQRPALSANETEGRYYPRLRE